MTARFPTYAAAAALLALALGTAPAARAQTGTDQPGTTQPAPAPAPMQPGQTPAPSRRMERVERHIAELHRRLHITSQEEAQWNAFAQVMRDNAARMDQAFQARRAQGPNMNAIEDLRSYAAVAQAHADDMQRLIPAFEALYQAMPQQQQKTADEVFRDFERRPRHG
ncbi:MAG TPA: Spy/CpxP family protein refolding chaperone [Acetobacteraceae bacterium]|nr:Spy/CpxP family protein refolding chaperone [Acetobacteraceae bacterium]